MVLERLGVTVLWQSDTVAHLLADDKVYILDVEAQLLHTGDGANLLRHAQLAQQFLCYGAPRELVVDSETASSFLSNVLGVPVLVAYDTLEVDIW